MKLRGVVLNGAVEGPFVLPNPISRFLSTETFSTPASIKCLEESLNISLYPYIFKFPLDEIIDPQIDVLHAQRVAIAEVSSNANASNVFPVITCSFQMDIPARKGVTIDDILDWEHKHIPLVELVDLEWQFPGMADSAQINIFESRYGKYVA